MESIVSGFKLPKGLRIYAIGDIHGFSSALDAMHQAISSDLLESPPEQAHIVYLGDYIDRGSDSRGVLDRLITRKTRGDGIEKTFILGNHETGLYEFIQNPHQSRWLDYGGIETLKSYGIHFAADVPLISEIEQAAEQLPHRIPQAHWDFLKSLETHRVIGDYFFVHAGVNPQKPLSSQSLRDLTFMREPFLSWLHPFEKMIIHGHTISPEPVVRPNRIGVDTGRYQGGKLTAAVIEADRVRFLQVT